MEDTAEVQKILASFAKDSGEFARSLDQTILKKDLSDLLVDLSEETGQERSELDKCKLLNSYAYTVASLYFVYLKAKGENKRNDHPIMQELARVKSYIDRVKRAETGESEPETAKPKPKKRSSAISSANFEGKHKRFDTKAPASKTGSSRATAASKKHGKYKPKRRA